MLQSLYMVLEVPATATRTEIRTAYRRQLARIRDGELSSSLRPLIERAGVTLDDPSRRMSYDARLAHLPRWERPRAPAPSAHLQLPMPALAAMAAAGAVVAVALAVLFVVLPSRGQHPASQPSQTVVSEVVTEPPVQADSTTIAEEPKPPEEAVASDQDEPSVVAAVRQPVQITTNRSALAQQPRGALAPAAAAAPSLPETDAVAPSAVEVAAPVAAPAPALVQSFPYGRVNANSSPRLDFRVQGWFCHDSSGGQIFLAAGASLPAGVTC